MNTPSIRNFLSEYFRWILLCLACLIVILSALGIKMVKSYRASSVSGDVEILRRINDIVELPTDEKPYIAHVTDRDQLAEDQQFFENSHQGDILVFYEKARLALLYRPDTRKIVTVTQVDFNDTGVVLTGNEVRSIEPNKEKPLAVEMNVSGQSSIDVSQLRVVVLNGSARNGAAFGVKAALSSWLDSERITVGNAQEAYSQTLIVNQTDAGSLTMEKLKGYIQGNTVSILPDGELPQDADVVIIIGTDGE